MRAATRVGGGGGLGNPPGRGTLKGLTRRIPDDGPCESLFGGLPIDSWDRGGAEPDDASFFDRPFKVSVRAAMVSFDSFGTDPGCWRMVQFRIPPVELEEMAR
jgi:hypothetical protein